MKIFLLAFPVFLCLTTKSVIADEENSNLVGIPCNTLELDPSTQ